MKRFLFAAVAGAGLLVATMGANAQGLWSGPEIGAQAGYGWGTSKGNISGVLPYKINPEGALGGVHAGYDWQSGGFVLGLEGDAEGSSLDGSQSQTIGANTFTGKSSMNFDASIRGRVGFAFDRVLLYGTGGVAFGNIQDRYIVNGTQVASDEDMRVGWTAGGGVAYAFTRNWEANLEYRYTDFGSHGFTNTATRPNFTDSNKFAFNAIRVGLTYRFAPPPPPPPAPPAPMPAAAPAPPPPPPPRTFLVFFDFDKATLTADARKVIDAAAFTYKKTGVARIEVSGYTDLSGTQAYNLRLSKRRADAVARYLAHLGVPRHVMDVKWFGKEHPRVPTPDGVREPQNRRVEIVMP